MKLPLVERHNMEETKRRNVEFGKMVFFNTRVVYTVRAQHHECHVKM